MCSLFLDWISDPMTFCNQHDGCTIKLAIKLYLKYNSFRKAAMHSTASKSSIHRWWHAIGHLNQRSKCQRCKRSRKRMYDTCMLSVEAIVSASGFVTLSELRHQLCDTSSHTGPVPSVSTISRMLKTLKFKRKRVKTHVTHTKPHVLAEKIKAFQELVKDVPLDQILSIDETGFGTHANVFHKYTRSTNDEKFEVPKRHSRSCVLAVTTMGILNPDSYVVKRGSFDTNSFVEYIDNVLTETPAQFHYVVMDNIAFHHSKRVAAVIERHGRVAIFTPPYSPRFNPIENVFSVLKRIFRKEFMTTKDLDHSIAFALNKYGVEYNDIMSTFAHCIRCPN